MGGYGGSWQCMLQMAAGTSLLCFPLICVAFQNEEPGQEISEAAVAQRPESGKPPAPAGTLSIEDPASNALAVTNIKSAPPKLPGTWNNSVTAALADGISTKLAISAGAVESNPLVPSSPMGMVALTGTKVLIALYANTLPEKEKRFLIKTSSSAWGGAAVNNVLVLMAAPPPLPIVAGIMMGIIFWHQSSRGYDKQDRLAELEKAKLATAPVPAPAQAAVQTPMQTSSEPLPALAP
jgi:hypothetical protein